MGVLEDARGQGLGRRLVQAAIARARDMGARSLYLETNSKLVAAMKLYAAEGFVQARGRPSPYARADVQMELALCTG
jgi:GNAT superfamily N-acetyltransferase